MSSVPGGYFGYGSFIREDLVESMSMSPNSYHEAMSMPITGWSGVQQLWIRVFMSTLILVNITLSDLPGPSWTTGAGFSC